jgi:hypothetical protein
MGKGCAGDYSPWHRQNKDFCGRKTKKGITPVFHGGLASKVMIDGDGRTRHDGSKQYKYKVCDDCCGSLH